MEATVVWDDDSTGKFIVSDVSAGPRAYPPGRGLATPIWPVKIEAFLALKTCTLNLSLG